MRARPETPPPDEAWFREKETEAGEAERRVEAILSSAAAAAPEMVALESAIAELSIERARLEPEEIQLERRRLAARDAPSAERVDDIETRYRRLIYALRRSMEACRTLRFLLEQRGTDVMAEDDLRRSNVAIRSAQKVLVDTIGRLSEDASQGPIVVQ